MSAHRHGPASPRPLRRPGLRESAEIFGYFVRRYLSRTLITIGCLVLSGIAEGLSITVFLPLLQYVTPGAPASGGRLSEWLTALLAVADLRPTLGVLLSCIVVGMALKGLLYWAAMHQVGYTIARVAADLRIQLLRTLILSRWDYFVGQPAGQFANAIGAEALKASGAYLNAANVMACSIQLCVYLLLACLMSWRTALAGIIAGLLFVLLMHRLIAATRVAGKRQVALLRSVAGRVVDMLHGIKPIKAMARETALLHYLEADAEELNKAQRTEVRANATVAALHEPVMTSVMAAGLYVILTRNLMPLTALLMQAFLFSRLFNQVQQIIQFYQRLVAYESSFISIRTRLEEADTKREREQGRPAPHPLRRGIVLRGVGYRYGDHAVLDDVTIELPARLWTALIGPSGAGKTTLLDLVAGLHTPQAGTILLDDQPLDETALASWRRRIGYVPQEMLLLNGSVFENVTLGEADLTRADVEQALRATDAWGFVEALPQGMDTPLGERGARLSGGQRQRIALARALVRNPELLILDEATASLDPATEAALCRTLTRLSRQTTILAISHQPAVAEAADRVYEVRDHGVTLVRDGSNAARAGA